MQMLQKQDWSQKKRVLVEMKLKQQKKKVVKLKAKSLTII